MADGRSYAPGPGRVAGPYDPWVLRVSAALCALVLVVRLVSPAEVPGLLDLRLLELFVVLIVAVECARRSALFDLLVSGILARVRSERALAAAAVLTAGATAAAVTNDVALLLVVPFTLAFEHVAPEFDPAPIVVLEIAAANLLGCLTPSGNPQNLFLFTRGGFTPSGFLAAQLPWVAAMTGALLLSVPVLVPRRPLPPAPPVVLRVRKRLATAGVGLLAVQVLSILGVLPRYAPLLATVPAAALLGRALLKTDFSLVAVFSFLFVVVEGLRRTPLFAQLDPIRHLGATPEAFVLAGALLSQGVSNVPAAILLAPSAAAAGGGALFTGLLYGVNAGGAGTPIASLANLIGADLYTRGRPLHRRFWRLFLPVSFALLVAGVAVSLLLVRLDGR